jgi:hypothetical protein
MTAPTAQQIEQVASMMFAASLAYTNTFGRKGFAWEACDEQSKVYWRRLAQLAWDVFNQPSAVTDSAKPAP